MIMLAPDWSILSFLVFILPPLLGYGHSRGGEGWFGREPPKPPRKKTPEELEVERIDREIERLNELKRLIKEETETERKLKEAVESMEPLKRKLEKIRDNIVQLKNPQ